MRRVTCDVLFVTCDVSQVRIPDQPGQYSLGCWRGGPENKDYHNIRLHGGKGHTCIPHREVVSGTVMLCHTPDVTQASSTSNMKLPP